jgi:hypothetical protein
MGASRTCLGTRTWALRFPFMAGGQQPIGGSWVTDLDARGSTRGLGAGGAMGSDRFAREREQAGIGQQI